MGRRAGSPRSAIHSANCNRPQTTQL